MDVLAAEADDHPTGVAQSVTYIPELESLRGIAMLLVLIFHVDSIVSWTLIPQGGYHVPLWGAMLRGGDAGVSLFFCLSAFLLSTPFLAQAAGGRRVDLRRFAVRRALRILPLYYAACMVAIVWTSASLADVVPKIPYLLFPGGIPLRTQPMHPFSNVWWSLQTETCFYIALPFLGVALSSTRMRRLAVAGLAAYAVTFALYEMRFFRWRGIPFDFAVSFSLFGQGAHFLFGIAAAAIYLHHGPALKKKLASRAWLRNGGGDLALAAIFLALSLLHQWRIGVSAEDARVPPYHAFQVVDGLLWSLLILAILLLPLRLKSLFHNRVFEHVGVLSYSIYILHLPVLAGIVDYLRLHHFGDFVGWDRTTAALAMTIVSVIYAASRLTYRFVEQPFLRRKELLGAERSRVRMQSPGAA